MGGKSRHVWNSGGDVPFPNVGKYVVDLEWQFSSSTACLDR